MKDKALKITQLVIGCIAAVVAVFYLVVSIMNLTNLSGNNEAKLNVYIVISALIGLLGVTCFVFVSLFTIKGYIKDFVAKKWAIYGLIGMLCVEVVSTFIGMCFWGFDSALGWIVTVFGIGGVVVLLLSQTGKFDEMVVTVLELVGSAIAFVISIMLLANAGNIVIALDLFLMFFSMAVGVYLLLELIFDQEVKPATKEE